MQPRYEDVCRWRYYCDTEGAWQEEYAASLPGVCKNNAAHTLSTTKLRQRIVEQIDERNIIQFSTLPNIAGYTRLFTLKIKDNNRSDFVLPAMTTTTMTWITPKYPIAILGMSSSVNMLQAKDMLNLWANKYTQVGVLSASVSPGATTFSVYPGTSVAQLFTSFEFALRDSALAETSTADTDGCFAVLTLGQYFTVWTANDATGYYVWMDTVGTGTTGDPAPGGGLVGVAVDVSAATNDGDLATAIADTLDALPGFAASEVGTVVTITNAATGPCTNIANVNVGSLTVSVVVQGRVVGSVIEDLGEIMDVKPSTNQVMTDTPTANSYTAWQTNVLAHRHIIKDLVFGRLNGETRYGSFSQQSIILPPQTIITITYQNNHPQNESLDVYMETQCGSQNLGYIA